MKKKKREPKPRPQPKNIYDDPNYMRRLRTYLARQEKPRSVSITDENGTVLTVTDLGMRKRKPKKPKTKAVIL